MIGFSNESCTHSYDFLLFDTSGTASLCDEYLTMPEKKFNISEGWESFFDETAKSTLSPILDNSLLLDTDYYNYKMVNSIEIYDYIAKHGCLVSIINSILSNIKSKMMNNYRAEIELYSDNINKCKDIFVTIFSKDRNIDIQGIADDIYSEEFEYLSKSDAGVAIVGTYEI